MGLAWGLKYGDSLICMPSFSFMDAITQLPGPNPGWSAARFSGVTSCVSVVTMVNRTSLSMTRAR